MSSDWFFEKFALIADAPGAVERMRRLVFELAFSGKLSDNDHQNDNVVGAWIAKPIEEIATSITPGFACSRDHKDDDGHVHLRTHNISTEGRMNFDLLVRINTKMIDPKKASLDAGDVLFNNTNSQDLVGKTCLVDKDYNFAFSNHITRIKLRDAVFPAFVVYYLTHLRNKGYFSRICTRWINQAAVNTDALKRLSIPLPPLAEQKRIVAKVEELMGLCDALEAQQQERELRKSVLVRSSLSRFAEAPTPENLGYLFHKSYDIPPSELRKSILTLAVQGKLVEQDINDESVKDLLLRNDARRREIARNDHRANEDNQLLLSADDRWEVTDTWSWQGLADLVLFVDYRGKTPVKMSDGIRLLTAKNVRKGHINLSPEEFLSESEYRDWMTRGFPKVGDVLFTTEAPMGNAAVVKLSERFALAQRIICFQSYGAIDPAFLVLQINSDQFQSILNTNGTGVTAKGIKASKLKQLPIAVPPLAEQRRIVAKVDKLMALVDELERQQEASRENATKLLDAIVQEMTSRGRGIAATLES
jgi:type I restriction enzyme S subunit